MRELPRGFGASSATNELWPVAGYLATAVLVIALLVAAMPRGPRAAPWAPAAVSAAPGLDEEVRRLAAAPPPLIARWRRALDALCANEALRRARFEVDCASGIVRLGDADFFETETGTLSARGGERLARGAELLIETLRAAGAWSDVERIEVRGHADPNAVRDPYTTNLATSRARAENVLLFLTERAPILDRDRAQLRRLAVLSAASEQRPPASCPERTRECFPHWRRVEIHLGLDQTRLRGEVEAHLARMRAAAETTR